MLCKLGKQSWFICLRATPPPTKFVKGHSCAISLLPLDLLVASPEIFRLLIDSRKPRDLTRKALLQFTGYSVVSRSNTFHILLLPFVPEVATHVKTPVKSSESLSNI